MKRFVWVFILLLTFAGLFSAPSAYALGPSDDSQKFIEAVDKCAGNTDCTNKQWYWTDSLNESAQYVSASVGLTSSKISYSPFYFKKSMVATVGDVVTAMYTSPPADLALWIRDTGQSLGFIPKQAYAQGIGFTGLSAILPIWQQFRNISYAIIAVIMIIIGFMVMFRRKIDPKTVVTVQNALPKIVFALLLVTFSYAIAAFFIDLMYVAMAVVINLIVQSNPSAFDANTVTTYLSGNLGTLITGLWGGGTASVDALVKLLFGNAATGMWGFVLTPVRALLANVIVGPLFSGIVAIAIIIGVIRIAFMLGTAYIQIIFSVLISPFQLMTEAFPGSSGFSSWAKNLFANLSVFPVTAALMLVGTMLTHTNTGTLWTPPLLNGPASGVTGLIGLGMLLTIPNIVHSIKEALKTKAVFGIGGAFGPAGGIAMQTISLGSMALGIKTAADQRAQMKEFAAMQAAGKGIGETYQNKVADAAKEPPPS